MRSKWLRLCLSILATSPVAGVAVAEEAAFYVALDGASSSATNDIELVSHSAFAGMEDELQVTRASLSDLEVRLATLENESVTPVAYNAVGGGSEDQPPVLRPVSNSQTARSDLLAGESHP